MKEPYGEGLASHTGSESCARSCKTEREALTGAGRRGSRALCRLADALCFNCRNIDTAARFGGDEFALVLPETGAESAKLVAQRICSTLAADGRDPKISVSVGAAIYPQDGQAIESILSAADLALYAMKAIRATPGPKFA